jgi:hypothetical protein
MAIDIVEETSYVFTGYPLKAGHFITSVR